MNGLEELIKMRDSGFEWLAINSKDFVAKIFKSKPYWCREGWFGIWAYDKSPALVELKKGETLALQRHYDFDMPIQISEAIETLQKYHQRVDMVKQSDMVKNPDHYTWKKKECREIQRDMVDGLEGMAASNMGNIIKYLYRVGHKDDIKQDLDKAKQYIDFLHEDL